MLVSAPFGRLYRVLQVLPLRPGDFPLSSNRSRAAARALILGRGNTVERREVILGSSAQGCSSPSTSEWRTSAKDGTIGRVISIPEGMTLENGLRALGGYSEAELAQAAEFSPEPLKASAMLMMRR